MSTINDSRPLNKYKIKASHNSYSDTIASLDPDPVVTRNLLQNHYRSLEFDVDYAPVKSQIVVRHFKNIGGHIIDDFLDVVIQFLINQDNNKVDPLFLHFDIKDIDDSRRFCVYLLDKLVELFNQNLYANVNRTRNQILKKHIISAEEVKNNGWPTLRNCRKVSGGKLVLGVHKTYLEEATRDENSISKDIKMYFHIDDEGNFRNYALWKIQPPFSIIPISQIQNEVNQDIIVRIYPVSILKAKTEDKEVVFIESRAAVTDEEYKSIVSKGMEAIPKSEDETSESMPYQQMPIQDTERSRLNEFLQQIPQDEHLDEYYSLYINQEPSANLPPDDYEFEEISSSMRNVVSSEAQIIALENDDLDDIFGEDGYILNYQ